MKIIAPCLLSLIPFILFSQDDYCPCMEEEYEEIFAEVSVADIEITEAIEYFKEEKEFEVEILLVEEKEEEELIKNKVSGKQIKKSKKYSMLKLKTNKLYRSGKKKKPKKYKGQCPKF